MSKEELRVGYALCGSFCTFAKSLKALETVTRRYRDVYPILSETAAATDTRFGSARAVREELEQLCRRPVTDSIAAAEPIGSKGLLDVLVIAPCTGNTLAKLAHGVTDTAVTMAAKAHLRNGRPVVIAVSTNDGLSVSLKNIAELLCRKNIYFVPFAQDDPEGKPNSLAADYELLTDTVEAARLGRQLQPILEGSLE